MGVYQQKLVQLKKDMASVSERTEKVKQRAIKLQMRKQQLREEETQKQQKQAELERRLMAIDTTETRQPT